MIVKGKKTYLSKVEKYIHCNKKEKKKLISFLENSIDLLIEERGDLTFDGLVAEFGEPQKAADELEGTISADEHRQYIGKAIKLKRLIASALVVFLVMLATWFVAMFLDPNKDNNGYFEESIEVVTGEILKE